MTIEQDYNKQTINAEGTLDRLKAVSSELISEVLQTGQNIRKKVASFHQKELVPLGEAIGRGLKFQDISAKLDLSTTINTSGLDKPDFDSLSKLVQTEHEAVIARANSRNEKAIISTKQNERSYEKKEELSWDEIKATYEDANQNNLKDIKILAKAFDIAKKEVKKNSSLSESLDIPDIFENAKEIAQSAYNEVQKAVTPEDSTEDIPIEMSNTKSNIT